MTGPSLSNKQIVAEITRRLGIRGIDVWVQPAVTTSSFYLTFDWGVLKKARVGDHRGKGYAYTYEIGKHYRNYEEVDRKWEGKTFTRRLYPSTDVGRLVNDVIMLRAQIIQKYGTDNYEAIVTKAKEKAVVR
jgi:hypothetical protein